MSAVLHEIVIDCNDVDAMAGFWGAVLGWEVQTGGQARWMSATGQPVDPPLLVFVPVPELKTVKDRLHLDVCPKGADQSEELERLLALGATRIDIGQGDVPWEVLADPEGNEFCLLARRVD